MRYLLFAFVMMAGKSFGQIQTWKPAYIIAAKDAYKYVGKLVVVQDSLYSGTLTNDTTVVCQIGAQTSTPRLTMIFIGRSRAVPLDQQKFVHTFQQAKLEIYGTITGSAQAPQIIVYSNMGFLRFAGTTPMAW